MTTLGALFTRPPQQYGLRGDVVLWPRVAQVLRDVPLPRHFSDVAEAVARAYEHEVGSPLPRHPAPDDMMRVDAFIVGHGMSDGMVSPHFWRHTAIPILIDRWAAAREAGS